MTKYITRSILVAGVVAFLLIGSTTVIEAPPTIVASLGVENSSVQAQSQVILPPAPAPPVAISPVPTPALSHLSPSSNTEPLPGVSAVRVTPSPIPHTTIVATPPARTRPTHPLTEAELYVHLPPQAQARQPLRAFVVLHGIGNRGDTFSKHLIKIADANHWVLVAPTFDYRNHLDPQQLREDDIQLSNRLLDTLDVLPQRLNLKLYRQVLIYGFSRGAQLGHRFTYFYPERVKSIAVLAAGAYTMPTERVASARGTPTIVPFPYGVGDLDECVGKPLDWQALRRVSFWIGVGEQDNHPHDVPRAFDPYGGQTRVERARNFKQALQNLGIEAYLAIFPNVSHEITPEMQIRALQFLREEELANPLDD